MESSNPTAKRRIQPWGKRYLAFLLPVILLALLVDLFLLQGVRSTWDLIAAALLTAGAVAFAFWPRPGGWVFLGLAVFFVASPIANVGMLIYMSPLVMFAWGLHKWWIDSLIGFASLLGAFWIGFLGRAERLPGILMLALLVAAGFVAGYWLRRYVDERDAALNQLWEEKLRAAEETRQFRNSLAVQLHDSLAGTLSVVASLSEIISTELPPESPLRSRAELLGTQTRNALGELRDVIQILDYRHGTAPTQLDLGKLIEASQAITAGAGLTLELEYDPEELRALPLQTQELLETVLRETTTNLVKYAAPSEPATLSITSAEGVVEFMAKNPYADSLEDAVMSSGMGLRLLRDRVEAAGGALDVWSGNGWWYVNAEIPINLGKPHEN